MPNSQLEGRAAPSLKGSRHSHIFTLFSVMPSAATGVASGMLNSQLEGRTASFSPKVLFFKVFFPKGQLLDLSQGEYVVAAGCYE